MIIHETEDALKVRVFSISVWTNPTADQRQKSSLRNSNPLAYLYNPLVILFRFWEACMTLIKVDGIKLCALYFFYSQPTSMSRICYITIASLRLLDDTQNMVNVNISVYWEEYYN
jgi:hypothetical protein